MPGRPSLTVVAVSHPGAVRERNEDSIAIGAFVAGASLVRPTTLQLADAPRLACLVVDGMGGHAHGDVASHLAATRMALGLLASTEPLEEAAALAVHEANAALYAQTAADPALTGMGCTVAGVLIEGDRIAVFNVGDSRVYRWQDGFLCQLTVDDTPGGTRSGGLLAQALGGAASQVGIVPHVALETWLPGRRYLLCTDGLFDALSLDAMEQALALQPDLAVQSLTEKALAANAPDNFSALLLLRP